MSLSGSVTMDQAGIKEGGKARRTPSLIVKNLMVSVMKLKLLGPYEVDGVEPLALVIFLSGDLCWFLCSS